MTPDLNLLVTLDVLLSTGSVAAAAKRLKLSPSAMSRALARLRKTTGDPLLVRAGRGLVPTPRALALRAQVSDLVRESSAVLRPGEKFDVAKLVRVFTLRASEGFVETFGPRLIERVAQEAPAVRFFFVQKPNKESAPLRDGSLDLDIGIVDQESSPEVRVQGLFRDSYVGVVRKGHPLSRVKVTAARYAAGRHVLVSRRGLDRGPIDDQLSRLKLERRVETIVAGFATAISLASDSDLIASVPGVMTASLLREMHTFPLPVPMPELVISMFWHPRQHADPAHKWMRGCVREVTRSGDS